MCLYYSSQKSVWRCNVSEGFMDKSWKGSNSCAHAQYDKQVGSHHDSSVKTPSDLSNSTVEIRFEQSHPYPDMKTLRICRLSQELLESSR
ncbi:hypothetical protein ILYODFUR_012399 [Ilyodon furcidens]|uniref:Uncharacterized protein n=1 Tax=Ilyodon furcidens TaxID=33524 RepID=A0ABV0URD5_9TELE